MDIRRWFIKDEGNVDGRREQAAWASHYAQLRSASGPDSASTPSSTRSPSPSCESSPRCSNRKSHPSTPPLPSSCTSLREYHSLGNRELWQWLWLDFSRVAQSKASKRLKRKLSNCNLEATAREAQAQVLHAIHEEPVGLSLLPPIGE